MAYFSSYELRSFTNILQQYTGFNFPSGLEQEFSLRLERALDQQGFSLNELLPKLYQSGDQQSTVKILTPLLPHLLIGETYFWREPDTFEALTRTILPEIIERKKPFSRLLRVWSAACSTGEEVYSLAILLKHYFKEDDWSWSVMGSDLNEKALELARKGEYGEYSFRTQSRQYPHCFEPVANSRRYRVKDEYRRGVRFQRINLAATEYPYPFNETCNYDLIFCRNIFIYFQPEFSEQVIDRLYDALNDGGYLVVSPCEYSTQLFRRFEAIQAGPVTFYRRPLRFWALMESSQVSLDTIPIQSQGFASLSQTPEREPGPLKLDPMLERASALATVNQKVATANFDQLMEQARLALTQNRPDEALRLGQEAIQADVLRAESYLLLAGIYQEQGQLEAALEMARKFSYLEPERPEGQFYLASLQQALGRGRRASLAYRRLITLLDNYPSQTRFENLPSLSCSELQQLALESLLLLQTNSNN